VPPWMRFEPLATKVRALPTLWFVSSLTVFPFRCCMRLASKLDSDEIAVPPYLQRCSHWMQTLRANEHMREAIFGNFEPADLEGFVWSVLSPVADLLIETSRLSGAAGRAGGTKLAAPSVARYVVCTIDQTATWPPTHQRTSCAAHCSVRWVARTTTAFVWGAGTPCGPRTRVDRSLSAGRAVSRRLRNSTF
jgi:hypothetical protein